MMLIWLSRALQMALQEYGITMVTFHFHIQIINLFVILGEIVSLLKAHEGLIYASKFNKEGNYILTVGIDKKAIVIM